VSEEPIPPDGCAWGPYLLSFASSDGEFTYSDPSWAAMLKDGGAMHCDGAGHPWHRLDREDAAYVRGVRQGREAAERERVEAEAEVARLKADPAVAAGLPARLGLAHPRDVEV